MTIGTVRGAVSGPLFIGNDNRAAAGEQFLGSIDEIRISSVARAANQMQFFSPLVTITQDPVSQNVDYNQPVTFSVSASSLTQLSYQWRFNSNSISGATMASYSIPSDRQQAAFAKLKDNNSHYFPIYVRELETNKLLVQNPFYK